MASAAAPFEGFASRPGRRARTRQELVLRALLYLVVAAGAVAFALPFYWMVRSAVMPPWQVWLYPPEWIPAGLHFENFLTPFAVFPFARWFANTAVVALATAVLTVATGAMVGFSFARLRFPLRDVLFVVLLATMMLPDQVRLVPTYLLFVKLEWVNTFLPLIIPNGLGPAFYVFLMRQFFMTIPAELDDAAYIDGCSPFGVFWRIALPLSLPAAGVAAIYSVTYSWNDFLHPLLYLQKLELYTLALGLRLFQGQLATQIEAMMAAALMSALPTVIIFFLAQRYFVQGIVITGLKG